MDMQTGFLFIPFLYNLAFNILIVLYRLLGENLGIAIIAFTLLIRFATLPFSIKQVKSAERSREFQEKYKEVQAKYNGTGKDKKNQTDKQKEDMAKELAKLQSEYLPAQLGGCLPLLLQLAFFFQVYYVLTNLISQGVEAFNQVNYEFVPEFESGYQVDLNFLGINLGSSPASIGFENINAVLPYLILVVLVGITQYFSMKVMTGLRSKPNPVDVEEELLLEKESKTGKGGGKVKKSKKKDSEDQKSKGKGQDKEKEVPEDMSFSDAMQQATKNTMFIFPFMTMFIGLNLPAGLSLYWSITAGFVIIQQVIVNWDKTKNVFSKIAPQFTSIFFKS